MTTRTEIDAQNTNVDHRVLNVIDEVRSAYHACTLRHVASVMRVSPTAVRNRLQRMREQGLVDWNDVPGSLRLTPAGMARIGVTITTATADVELSAVGKLGSDTEVSTTPDVAAVVGAAVAHAVAEALGALGITATTTTTADQAAEEDHADPTSPEGSPAGTPDTAD